MFLDFFYLLRSKEISISMDEWLTLMEAMNKGLGNSSLVGFYDLCRAILIKSEAEYDKFDLAFAEYFQGIETPEDLPKEFWKWLSEDVRVRDINDKPMPEDFLKELEELLETLKKRIEEQKEKHNRGSYWIGTGGISTQGHSGYNPRGIRTGGEGRHRSAVQIAGERNFKDFREDTVLDIRQFQIAFRKLRQFSSRIDSQKTELDIDKTIDETCDNAGYLKLVFDKPRKNTVKILLLMDSDGSMMRYSRLCNRLFQAASKSSHFKDLKVYYFHNCIYEHLYTTPLCKTNEWIDTDWVLKNLDQEYKLILVGDATMAMSELLKKGGNCTLGMFNEEPGIDWLKKFKRRYKKQIWLNPIQEADWEHVYGSESIAAIKNVFPMFELSLEGLDKGIKKLLSR